MWGLPGPGSSWSWGEFALSSPSFIDPVLDKAHSPPAANDAGLPGLYTIDAGQKVFHAGLKRVFL